MNYINIAKILSQYPSLIIEKYDDNKNPQRISGEFIMNSSFKDVFFCKKYHIIINLSKCPPSVTETGHMISRNYPHIYSNGELCLEVPARMMLSCIDGECFDFEKWFNMFVIPYFFSYEYYKRFGLYPFGERSHNEQGILEYYAELFHLLIGQQTKKFLQQILKMKVYRGHHLCPCGSGKKIRNCHKKEVEMALKPLYKKCIEKDLRKEWEGERY